MTRVVYAPFKSARLGKKSGAVTMKRIKTPDGEAITLHTVSAESRTFPEDLSYVFRKNVKKARKANKQVTGSADRASAKG